MGLYHRVPHALASCEFESKASFIPYNRRVCFLSQLSNVLLCRVEVGKVGSEGRAKLEKASIALSMTLDVVL